MKTFLFLVMMVLPTVLSAVTLTVSPDQPVLNADPANLEADTLRILSRGNRPLVIGEYAFWNSTALKCVELPPVLCLTLKEGAFRDCRNLTTISLPNGTHLDGQYIFSGCSSLNEVLLPEDMRTLPPQTFSYCVSLRQIRLPETLEKIGNNSFSECRALREIYIPESVTELESYAFSECISLKSARLPDNGSLLGELIFSGCRALERIVEPSRKVPQFDCNSFIFEPDEKELYRKCELYVSEGMTDRYRSAAGWSLFEVIK